MNPKSTLTRLLSILGLAILAACSGKPESGATPAAPASGAAAPASSAAASAASAPASAASAPLPPVTVTTVKAQKRDFSITLKAAGTVMALTSVEVRPQVSSTVSQVHFREGQFVKPGQLLFTLDARADEANAAKARAQLAKDNATLADARRQLDRARQLVAQNFLSQGAVDTAQAQVDAGVATVAADQAAIDATRVALSFAKITAPNAGRAGAVTVSAGSAVQANVTPLVTITQLDPIGVGFSIPQRNLTDALGALKDGGAAVSATLADGGGQFKGRLKFVDNTIDASSGAVKVKAVFPNPDSKLWPGAFVEVQQSVSTVKDAVVVPQSAVIVGARGTIVYVVAEGKASLRPVKVLYSEGTDAVVGGVKPGEVLVLDGKQNVRPNSPIIERPKEPKDGKAAAPTGSASAAASAPAASASGSASAPAKPATP